MTLLRPLLLTSAILAALPALAQTAAPTTAPTSGPVTAATPEENSSGEAVVVTARRVSERLQDVPLSIRALTGKELSERGVTSLSELSQFTPGLAYSPDFGRVGERPVIRGISALRTEAPQPVSVFIDGIFVRDGALGLAVDDAARVEVIKGPQSALYGRSTYAGAINYITVKPKNTLTGRVSVSVATHDELSAFGAISVPLITDVLSMRVRLKRFEYGGEYTNSQTGNKIGSERTNSGGIVLAFTPSSTFDGSLALDHSNDRDGIFAATVRPVPIQAGGVVTNQNGSSNLANGATCNGRTINIVGNGPNGLPSALVPPTAAARANGWPCGPAVFSGTTVRRNEADLASYTDPVTGIHYGNIAGLDRSITRGALTMNFNFANGYTLTSQTGLTKQASNVGADQSYNGTRFAPGFGQPASSWLSYDRDKLDYQSQELRLSAPLDQAFTWLVGGYFYKEEFEGISSGVFGQNAAFQTIVAQMRPKAASSVRNFAPFGRMQYEFTKSLRASVEGRYSSEQVKVGGTALGTAIATVGTCVTGQVCFVNGDRTFKDFAPRVTLDFKPTPDILLYGQVAKGSKSGGFNTTPGLPASSFEYEGEKITSGELGVKSELAGGLLRLNVALFQNNVSGLQLSNLSTVTNPFTNAASTTTIVNNVGKARTRGLETEMTLRATPWLTLTANYAYTDAKALEGTEITNGTVFGGNTSVAGFTLPRAAKHSVAASAALDLPMDALPNARGLRFFARTDVLYQSRRYAEIQNMIWADPSTRINASAGIKSRDWRATVFVKNADNDNTSMNGFRYLDPATFRRTAVDFLPRNRQFGATVAYDF